MLSRSRRDRSSLQLDPLERRVLLSGIPLNSTTWTPIGPQPITVGNTPGSLSVSGRISAIAVDPNNPSSIYAATGGGGVWKSSDGGSTWAALTDSQSTLFMGAIAIDPQNSSTIYAGTGNPSISNLSFTGKGILKSTNGGTTWTLLGSSVFNRRTISQVVVDPTNPNTIYAAVAGGGINGVSGGTGIWKSTDGGNTWTNTTTAISTSASYTDLVINPANPQNLFAAVGTFYGDFSNGVYQTTNGGASWSAVPGLATGNANGWIRLAISANSSATTLYASIAGTGVIGSTPLGTLFKLAKLTVTSAGSSWTTLSPPNYLGGTYINGGTAGGGYFDSALAVSATNPNLVFAGGASSTNSIVYSTDGGSTWTNLSSAAGGGGPHGGHHDLIVDSAGNLLDATDGGAFKYTVSTNTWTSLNNGLNITQVNSVALNPANPNIAYIAAQDNGTDEFTGSLGWSSLRLSSAGVVLDDYNTPATVYREEAISVGSSFIERSDNSGASWSNATSGIGTTDISNNYPALVMDPGNPQRLLVGTNRVYESTNKGASWTARSTTGSNGWSVSDPIDAIAAAQSDINTIYATDDGYVFVTTNRGSSWTQTSPVSSPSSSLLLNDIVVDPTNAQIAYVVAANFSDTTGGPHIWRTTNGGTSWTNISGNLPDIPVWSIALDPNGAGSSDDVLYIGTDAGAYRSSNLGASWSIFGSGLPNAQVRDLAYINSNTLAAGTDGRGVWEIQIDRTPLTATIPDVVPDPRTSPVSSMTISFNKPVTGFTMADLTLKLNGGSNLLTASQTLTTTDNTTFTLNNLSSLTSANGTYTLTVTGANGAIIDAAGNSLSAPASDTFTIGTVNTNAPQVSSAVFNDDHAQHTLTFTFTQNVGANLGPSDLTVTNLQTMQTEPVALSSYNSQTNTAIFTFSGVPNGTLPDDNYQADLGDAGVVNSSGTPMAADYVMSFFHFTADANHDRTVNTADFAILAAHYNQTAGAIFSLGDFNYDGTINALDFNALASSYGAILNPGSGGSLPEVQPLAASRVKPLSSAAARQNLFSNDPVSPTDDLTRLIL